MLATLVGLVVIAIFIATCFGDIAVRDSVNGVDIDIVDSSSPNWYNPTSTTNSACIGYPGMHTEGCTTDYPEEYMAYDYDLDQLADADAPSMPLPHPSITFGLDGGGESAEGAATDQKLWMEREYAWIQTPGDLLNGQWTYFRAMLSIDGQVVDEDHLGTTAHRGVDLSLPVYVGSHPDIVNGNGAADTSSDNCPNCAANSCGITCGHGAISGYVGCLTDVAIDMKGVGLGDPVEVVNTALMALTTLLALASAYKRMVAAAGKRRPTARCGGVALLTLLYVTLAMPGMAVASLTNSTTGMGLVEAGNVQFLDTTPLHAVRPRPGPSMVSIPMPDGHRVLQGEQSCRHAVVHLISDYYLLGS
jgi:hypothetical protein